MEGKTAKPCFSAFLQRSAAEERLWSKKMSPAGCCLAGTVAGRHNPYFPSLLESPVKTQGRQ